MKKIIVLLIVITILLIATVLISYEYTNNMISNDDYNNLHQWITTGMWKIRDVFFPCSTEVKLMRTIAYSMPPLLEDEIKEEIIMPDLSGFSAVDVIYNLKKYGYEVTIKYVQTGNYDENRIVSHNPSNGIKIKPGDMIEIAIEDSMGNTSNNLNGKTQLGPSVVAQGEDIFYYDNTNKVIIKTDYDFINQQIIYHGEVGKLNAKGQYLYFYSYDKETVFRYNIQSYETEELFYGLIRQLMLFNNYIYYTDMNDDLKLKRVEIDTKESEVICSDSIAYFQIENDVIYYLRFKPQDNIISSITLQGENEKVVNNQVNSIFLVKDEFIYYVKPYKSKWYEMWYGSEGTLVKQDIKTNKVYKMSNDVAYFMIENEFQLFMNYGRGFKDNRSLKGILGLYKLSNEKELYYDYYAVGKKVFLRTIDGWHIFDGRELSKLD